MDGGVSLGGGGLKWSVLQISLGVEVAFQGDAKMPPWPSWRSPFPWGVYIAIIFLRFITFVLLDGCFPLPPPLPSPRPRRNDSHTPPAGAWVWQESQNEFFSPLWDDTQKLFLEHFTTEIYFETWFAFVCRRLCLDSKRTCVTYVRIAYAAIPHPPPHLQSPPPLDPLFKTPTLAGKKWDVGPIPLHMCVWWLITIGPHAINPRRVNA